MRAQRTGLLLSCLILSGATGALAQGNLLDSQELQEMQRFWNPVVGSAETYQRAGASGEQGQAMELAVVGTETVQGKRGYWLELGMDLPELGGKVYNKYLLVSGERTPRRVITQIPGEAAMELPQEMVDASMKLKPDRLQKVGTQTITVPAGTFVCEHWKDKDTDAWIASKLSPTTLVKMVSKGDTDILVSVTSNAKDRITGPVKPFDASVLLKHMKRPGGGD